MKNHNIDSALDKAIAKLKKLDEDAAVINAKQKSAKAEVARLTMVKYGKPYYDFTANLDQKGIAYDADAVKAAFEANDFLALHELTLKSKVVNETISISADDISNNFDSHETV